MSCSERCLKEPVYRPALEERQTKMKEESEESHDTEDCSNVGWKFSFGVTGKIIFWNQFNQKTVILHLKIFHNIIMFSLQFIFLFFIFY